jgi:hypothetical protein
VGPDPLVPSPKIQLYASASPFGPVTGVAAREPVDPAHDSSGEGATGALADDVVQRAEAQPADSHRPEPRPEPASQCGRKSGGSRGHYERYRLRRQPARGKRERVARRRVEPLRVLDRHDDASGRRELPERRQQRHADRPDIRRPVVVLLAEERDGERASLRCRQSREHLFDRLPEQVAEAHEAERRFGLRRAARQHPVSASLGFSDGGLPQGRLADPRLALDEDRDGPLRIAGQTLLDRRELVLAADDPHAAIAHAGPNDATEARY